ncbi:MAG: hypothetical protein QXJ18_05800 [Desulfurococcaceae archaeon]
MRKKLEPVLLLFIVLLVGLLFNPRVYAYNLAYNLDRILVQWLEERRDAIGVHCAGFIVSELFTLDVGIRGYNVQCRDRLERSVYEYVRLNVVAKSPGTTVYRAILFFYVNTSTDLVVEVVVEKPLSENQLVVLLENKYTRVYVNASTVARVRVHVQPGEHYYRITFILHAVQPGREVFRLGFYLGANA